LAWANAPCKEHPTYWVLGHIWFLKIIEGYKWTKWTLIHNTLVFCLFDHFACKMGLQTSNSIINLKSQPKPKDPHIKLDLLPRSQNLLSYYTL
jgi:hypothetical protein